MDYKIRESGGELFVTATIGAARKGEPAGRISTADVLKWLSKNYSKHKKLNLIQEGRAHNAALKEQRTGIWVFSLPSKKSQNTPKTASPKGKKTTS